MNVNKKYDFIICGAGCASLTFLYDLFSVKKFQNLNILVIDSNLEKSNDRTWCFWSKEKIGFENVIAYKWKKLLFKTNSYKKNLEIEPYQYNKIKGEDFYNFTLNFLKKFENICFLQDKITAIENKAATAIVKTETNLEIEADYVFNSTLVNTDKNKVNTLNSLVQHFLGYEIETTENYFNEDEATFMDFSVEQNLGTAFVYVLPTCATKALVEYTFFTKTVLAKNLYENLLNNYITQKLNIKNYKITHTEFGIIPMTDYVFKQYDKQIINIGTAAGWVKPSTGYAFKNIQKQSKRLVQLLIDNKKPFLKRTFSQKKFHLYDSILLEVINKNKLSAATIFEMIFKKNKPSLVLKFLDNETSLLEDLKIMSSVPTLIFLPIAIKKIFLNLFTPK